MSGLGNVTDFPSFLKAISNEWYPKKLIFSGLEVKVTPFNNKQLKEFYKIREYVKDDKTGKDDKAKLLEAVRDFLTGKVLHKDKNEIVNLNDMHYYDFIDLIMFIKGISVSNDTVRTFTCPAKDCGAKTDVTFKMSDLSIMDAEKKDGFKELVLEDFSEGVNLSMIFKDYTVRNYLEYLLMLKELKVDDTDSDDVEKFKIAFFMDTLVVMDKKTGDTKTFDNMELSEKFKFTSERNEKQTDRLINGYNDRASIFWRTEIECSNPKCKAKYTYGIMDEEFEDFFV